MPQASPGFWQQVAIVARKDLRIEGRSPEVLYTMGFLAVLVVLVFSFSFVSGADPTVNPGVSAAVPTITLSAPASSAVATASSVR